MRVIIFSRQETAKRLVVCLTEQGIDVTFISDRLDKTAELRGDSDFDLGIVDDLAQDALLACHRIKKEWNIPLILMVNNRHSDWKRAWFLNADGYILSDVGDCELRARLSVLVRRLRIRKTSKVQQATDRIKHIEVSQGPIEQESDSMPDLTAAEVAKLLDIHISTVRRWSKSGILPSYGNGNQKGRKFKQKDINTFLGIYSMKRKSK